VREGEGGAKVGTGTWPSTAPRKKEAHPQPRLAGWYRRAPCRWSSSTTMERSRSSGPSQPPRHRRQVALQVERVRRMPVLREREDLEGRGQPFAHPSSAVVTASGPPCAQYEIGVVGGSLQPRVVVGADRITCPPQFARVHRPPCEKVDDEHLRVAPSGTVRAHLADGGVVRAGVRRARIEHHEHGPQ